MAPLSSLDRVTSYHYESGLDAPSMTSLSPHARTIVGDIEQDECWVEDGNGYHSENLNSFEPLPVPDKQFGDDETLGEFHSVLDSLYPWHFVQMGEHCTSQNLKAQKTRSFWTLVLGIHKSLVGFEQTELFEA